MAIERVAVVGAGTMGSGIAQVLALAGFPLKLIDVASGQVERALRAIDVDLSKAVANRRISETQRVEALGRIVGSVEITDASDADLVIEAIVEDFGAKSSLLRELDRVCRPEAIFASNTSSISITRLAGATSRSDRVIGMHFFNPVPAMRLVEVIRGMATSDNTMTLVLQAVQALGKTAVAVQDYPGFVSNRLLMPMINEAAYALMEGVATRDAIDTVMKLGMNHPMGPLELADLIGLDVCLYIMRVLQEGFGDDKYRPCPLLVNMVAAGRLGRKVGRGFYDYQD
ncbi:MAG: 3-hydroxybutyryl-CoA dehydrogenase [Sphingomonadaceae bacterium]